VTWNFSVYDFCEYAHKIYYFEIQTQIQIEIEVEIEVEVEVEKLYTNVFTSGYYNSYELVVLVFKLNQTLIFHKNSFLLNIEISKAFS